MALLRRRTAPARARARQSSAIRGFWGWWQGGGAAETAAAIAAGEPERVVGRLNGRVDAVDPGLAWELGAGTDGRHLLVVTSEGNPQLRAVARRWRLAAPAPDQVWEYADARRPTDDPAAVTLRFGPVEIDLAAATASARMHGAAVDVGVYHPALSDLPQRSRESAAYVMLATVLGEEAVETWVGAVTCSAAAPLDPVPLAGLRSVVRELRERFTDESGDPAWVLLEGQAEDGTRVLAGAQVPLRAATAAHLDTHVAVGVPYLHRTPDGLPAEASLEALRALEDHLVERLGGSGRIVAHETGGGTRILHAYVDGGTPAADQLRAAVVGWDQGPVQLGVTLDPGWEGVGHLRA